MFLNLKRWTLVGTAASSVLLLCAAFSPQWTYNLGLTTAAGLREECGVVQASDGSLVGLGYCHPLSHTKAAALSKCCVGDVKKFSSFRRVLETFAWAGAVIMGLAAGTCILQASGSVRGSPGSLTRSIHILNISGVVSFIIALAVAVSMFDIHGPRTQCEGNVFKPCAYMGTAAITGVIALALSVAATVCGLVGSYALPSHRSQLMSATLFFAATSAAFAVASALTPSWVHFMGTPDSIVSMGLLQYCAGATCKSIDFSLTFAGTCHGKDVSASVKSRFGATLAMIIIGSVAAAIAAAAQVVAALAAAQFPALAVAFAATVVGLAVIGDTIDAWYLCGESYFGANSAVRWGVSFGLAVTAALALAALLLLHLVQFMWYSGSDGSDGVDAGAVAVGEDADDSAGAAAEKPTATKDAPVVVMPASTHVAALETPTAAPGSDEHAVETISAPQSRVGGDAESGEAESLPGALQVDVAV